MSKEFNIEQIITKLSKKRKIYVSEADLQLEMAWVIKEEYPDAKIRLEYCPEFNTKMHIDILVIIKDEWIPIELKYKTKKGIKEDENNKGEKIYLKEHGARDVNCYLYLRDIQRIESIKNNINKFKEGYAIFLTNDLGYSKPPRKAECVYKNFALNQGAKRNGKLDWTKNTSAGTKKNCETPIDLRGNYIMDWKDYSKIDDTNTGTFKILINKISSQN